MFHFHPPKISALKFSSVSRSARRPMITQLVACLAIGGVLAGCVQTEDAVDDPAADTEAALAGDDVRFTGLDGEAYVASAGVLSVEQRRVVWTTEVNGQSYVVEGRIRSTEPLIGRLSVSSGGQELLAFSFNDGELSSTSAGNDETAFADWPRPPGPIEPQAGLDQGAADLIAENTLDSSLTAPMLLEAFLARIDRRASALPSSDDGVGTVSQGSLIGLILALVALVTAVTGLITAIDRADGGICNGSSAACADGSGSATCSGCLVARCNVIFGVAGEICTCGCF